MVPKLTAIKALRLAQPSEGTSGVNLSPSHVADVLTHAPSTLEELTWPMGTTWTASQKEALKPQAAGRGVRLVLVRIVDEFEEWLWREARGDYDLEYDDDYDPYDPYQYSVRRTRQ